MSMERCYHLDTTRLRPKHFKDRDLVYAGCDARVALCKQKADKATAYQILCSVCVFG